MLFFKYLKTLTRYSSCIAQLSLRFCCSRRSGWNGHRLQLLSHILSNGLSFEAFRGDLTWICSSVFFMIAVKGRWQRSVIFNWNRIKVVLCYLTWSLVAINFAFNSFSRRSATVHGCWSQADSTLNLDNWRVCRCMGQWPLLMRYLLLKNLVVLDLCAIF